jgi:hypothetical protein
MFSKVTFFLVTIYLDNLLCLPLLCEKAWQQDTSLIQMFEAIDNRLHVQIKKKYI